MSKLSTSHKSLIHSRSILLKWGGLVKVKFFLLVFCLWCSIPAVPFVEKGTLPSRNYFCTCVKHQLGLFVWVYFCVPSSNPKPVCFTPPSIARCLDYCNYVTGLNITKLIPPTFILFTWFYYSRCCAYVNFRIPLSMSTKSLAGIERKCT